MQHYLLITLISTLILSGSSLCMNQQGEYTKVITQDSKTMCERYEAAQSLYLAQEYEKALEVFEALTQQTVNPPVQAQALFKIGMMHYQGIRGKKDFVKALEYYERALKHKCTTHENFATILPRIGDIYYSGGHGVQRHFFQALQFLFPAYTNPSVTKADKISVTAGIGFIYFFGGHGEKQNNQKAHKYLLKTARQDIKPDLRDYARKLFESEQAHNESKPGEKRKDHPVDPETDSPAPKRSKKETL